MKVGELCHRNPVTVSASASALEAARLMCEHGIGAVIVTATPAEAPVAVGMITDRDLVRAQLAQTADLGQLRLADVMAPDPLVVSENEAVEAAIHRMGARGVRRAPVISSSGALVGLISFDDLLTHVSGSLAALAQLTQHQMQARPAAGK